MSSRRYLIPLMALMIVLISGATAVVSVSSTPSQLSFAGDQGYAMATRRATSVPLRCPRTCARMTSCEQARACLRAGYNQFDRDGDGVPCEAICPGG